MSIQVLDRDEQPTPHQPDIERMTRRLRKVFIHIPHVERLMARMERLYAHRCTTEEPEHLMIVGESGVGKTRVLQEYCRHKLSVDHPEFREIPVLYVPVMPSCTIKKLATEVLKALGSPFWNRGNEQDRTDQVLKLLPVCRVRLIILDEVNHLLDRGRHNTHYAVADSIKQFGDKTGVSLVLAGTPVVEDMPFTNEQLRGRFGEVFRLAPLTLATDTDIEIFVSVLGSFASLLSGLDSVDITSKPLVRSMAFASAGRLRALRRLLVRAVELAGEQSPPALTLQTLERAFSEVIYPDARPERNPFSRKFDSQPLVQPGEPYGPFRKR